MTELDKFVPTGIPVHPYDVYEMVSRGSKLKTMADSPKPVDQADYERNMAAMGEILDIDGEIYFMTTIVPPLTKRFYQ